ncbi:MAG: hypothetical protein KGH61_05100 [Candidatus Micrarchaeota archaeon]|nr:hypothetical protein [Candidatus Micrarchaeota archaeon]
MAIEKTEKKNTWGRIDEVTSQKGLVSEAPASADILSRIKRAGEENRGFRILYGETFDDKGNPLDSLKYYLFVAGLAKSIEQNYDVVVEPIILVADAGVYRNYPEQAEQLRENAKSRLEFAKRAKEVYNCSYEVRLMSELAETDEFKERFERVSKVSMASQELMQMIERSVPEDRRDMERARGYIYSFEEIAVILGRDIKVGPPREKLYDSAANAMLAHFEVMPLMGVYLTQTYPLGMKYGEYMSSAAIKQYGLTPYKVGSSNLAPNRIVIGGTQTREQVRELITNSQITPSLTKPNPVLDVAIIAEAARQHIEGRFEKSDLHEKYYSNKIKSHELKELAMSSLEENVLRRF